ncbi:Thioredoxin-2 [Lobulomyces angularis]|nr:Thioredoxin-2 [Lobulomyces angularis]
MVQEIKDKEDFEKVLSEHKVVVVDFTATWCGPCKMVAPKFEEMSKKYPDAVFVKVDVDQCQDISQNAGIR